MDRSKWDEIYIPLMIATKSAKLFFICLFFSTPFFTQTSISIVLLLTLNITQSVQKYDHNLQHSYDTYNCLDSRDLHPRTL